MANKITKALIPAAGFGTRFLPQTKAMPKEMLPLVDKPVIQYVVEEAVASGIETVIIVTGANKRAIEDHFDEPSEDLVQTLINGNKTAALEQINKISSMADFVYVRQKGPYGNGIPVLAGEPIIENEPFAVLWGDEFILSEPPRLKQMMEVYEKYGGIVISGVRLPRHELKSYGIADIEPVEGNLFKIKQIIEKPEPGEEPSDLATHGAYILPPEIFDALKRVEPGKGGEIWLVDAINLLKKEGVPLFALEIPNGTYYDTGNKLAYLKSVVDLARRHPDIGQDFEAHLKDLVENLKN